MHHHCAGVHHLIELFAQLILAMPLRKWWRIHHWRTGSVALHWSFDQSNVASTRSLCFCFFSPSPTCPLPNLLACTLKALIITAVLTLSFHLLTPHIFSFSLVWATGMNFNGQDVTAGQGATVLNTPTVELIFVVQLSFPCHSSHSVFTFSCRR